MFLTESLTTRHDLTLIWTRHFTTASQVCGHPVGRCPSFDAHSFRRCFNDVSVYPLVSGPGRSSSCRAVLCIHCVCNVSDLRLSVRAVFTELNLETAVLVATLRGRCSVIRLPALATVQVFTELKHFLISISGNNPRLFVVLLCLNISAAVIK